MRSGLTRVPLSSGETRRAQSACGRSSAVVTCAPVSACRRTTTASRPYGGGLSILRAANPLWSADRSDRRVSSKLADDGREEKPRQPRSPHDQAPGGVHRLDGQAMVVLDVDRSRNRAQALARRIARIANRNIPVGERQLNENMSGGR